MGVVQGVLQIVNRDTDNMLLTQDNSRYLMEEKLSVLSEIIATAIRNANISTNLMSLSHSMQEGIGSVSY